MSKKEIAAFSYQKKPFLKNHKMSALIHHIKRTSLMSRPMQPRVESPWSWRPDPRPFLRRERTPLGTGSGIFDAALGTGSGVCDAALGTGSGLCYAKRCRQPVVAGVGPGAAVSPPSFSALRAQWPRASAVGPVGPVARRGPWGQVRGGALPPGAPVTPPLSSPGPSKPSTLTFWRPPALPAAPCSS